MLCLDTYALSEIHRGNARFDFLFEEDYVVTNLTLVEFYGIILREHNVATADYVTRKFEGAMKKVPFDILKKAAIFRNSNKDKNISFFDAQGYIFAMENGHKFVTGDAAFKRMKGVLFVK